jgi:hypothetical protein
MRKPTSIIDLIITILVALIVVALGATAAIISYSHALDVALGHGQTGRSAHLTPLTVDGMVLVPSLVTYAAARRHLRGPVLAHVTLALGIAATLAVNVLYGIEHGPIGAVVAGWPAVALVLSHYLFMGMIRRGRPVVESDGMDEHVKAALKLTAARPSRRPVPSAVAVEGPFVAALEAPGEALAIQGSGRPAEASDPAQAVVKDVPSAVIAARATGLSYQRIADEFGVTKYRVEKILKTVAV